MTDYVIFLSIPGLREQDLQRMPQLKSWAASGDQRKLVPSFPAVTWPVQANMLTGKKPNEHGVIANGFYWRDQQRVEMWTAGNQVIQAPQIWDQLHQLDAQHTSAAWFPMLSKGCGADYVCMPAPIHNPDGSESLWCYTKPTLLYGDLRDGQGHFPLQHFWGPMANIRSTAWIADSAVFAVERFQPHFFYIYLPHLDYAAQKHGPDSEPALSALAELDSTIAKLVSGMEKSLAGQRILWLAASEYVITPVSHVTYSNRVLREAGLLAVKQQDGGEYLDLAESRAWALVDHQFAHVFVRDANESVMNQVADLFRGREGIAEVLVGDERRKYAMDHERSGEVILILAPNSWQAYYWWLDDARALKFVRTVDIHAKPGYDPVELHFDPATKGIPLDATRIRGSHGAPATDASQQGILISSQAGTLSAPHYADTDIAPLVLSNFMFPRESG